MNPDRVQFLNLRHPPARLNAEETAWYLGFLPHEIPILIAVKALRPLGSPAPNGCKYFAQAELEKLRNNTAWLSKASSAIVRHWRGKNNRKGVYSVFQKASAAT